MDLTAFQKAGVDRWHGMQQVADRLEARGQRKAKAVGSSNPKDYERWKRVQHRAHELWDVLSVDEMNYVLDNAARYL